MPSWRFLSNKPLLPRKIKKAKEGPQDPRNETNRAIFFTPSNSDSKNKGKRT